MLSICLEILCLAAFAAIAASISSSFIKRRTTGSILLTALVLTTLSSLVGRTASAQSTTATENALYSFCSVGNCTDGESPESLVQGSDGNFYGTAEWGGANNEGTVFQLTPTGTLTTIYNFCTDTRCADGEEPAALLWGSDGNLYGITGEGGTGDEGTIFKITPSGTLTTLYSFCAQNADCPDGSYPTSLVQGSDGNFYGTTEEGGANSYGTLFKITSSGTLTTLYNFCSQGGENCTDGYDPAGNLVQGSDGNFYGTTEEGGANYDGTVFKITPSGTLITLYSFCSQSGCTDGDYPYAGLVEGNDGNFYGTTEDGGANGGGTVFNITPSTPSTPSALTTLYSFCSQSNCTDGEEPYAGLIEGSDGNFYGTTGDGGGSGWGTLFQITPPIPSTQSTPPTPPALTTLYNFCTQNNCTDGAYPEASLLQSSNGSFYGTTDEGGANDDGTVFQLTPSPALPAPVQLSFSSPQVDAGSPVTLTWQVLNAFSTTMQQCYASVQNAASDAGTWTGLQTGTLSNNVYSGSTSIMPTAAGTYTYALTCGGMESGFGTLTVGPAPPLSVQTTTLPGGTVNTPYSQALQATGGVPTYTWSASPANLPLGLSLSSSGVLSGVATQPGIYNFTVQVSDSEPTPQTTSASVSISITQAAPTITLIASSTTGVTYDQTVTLSAAESPVEGVSQGYTWSIYDGSTALVTNAAPNANGNFTMTTPALSVGQHTFTATYGSAMGGYLSGTSNAVTVNVGKASTTTTLTATAADANLDGSLTFTAAVASTVTGTPTGSVQFMDGSTVLATSALAGGTATYTTTSSAAGTDFITAVYSGDVNFSGSTSTAIPVVVTAPAFTLAASPSSLSIAAGKTGEAIITLTPVGGYNGSINLSCSGLPQNANCSFSPATLSANGSNAAVSSVLTIATNVSTTASLKNAQPELPSRNPAPMYAAGSLASLALLFGFRRRLSTARRFRSAVLLLAVLALGSFVLISGCGGGNSSSSTTPTTPAGNSTVVVTASAGTGGAQQTLNLAVTITQ